jgi:hypothetical protein
MMIFNQIFRILVLIFVVIVQPVFAVTDSEIDEQITKLVEQNSITDENQINALRSQVRSIIKMKQKMIFDAIVEPCTDDFEKLCSNSNDTSTYIECLKENRKSVTQMCEEALKKQFGNLPLKEAGLYKGVVLPKGSILTFSIHGEVIRAIASENFNYKGLTFKKGQVMFHKTSLHFASLTNDQLIDGIKYKANGIGPFFNENGEVENATLAEDTEIGGIFYKASQITFHAKNKVKHGTLAQDITIDGYVFKAKRPVWLDSNGVINKSQYEETDKKFGAMYDKSNN